MIIMRYSRSSFFLVLASLLVQLSATVLDDSPTTSSLLYFDNDRLPVDLLEESVSVTRIPEIAGVESSSQLASSEEPSVSSSSPEISSTEGSSSSTESTPIRTTVTRVTSTVRPRITNIVPTATQTPTFPPPLAKDPIGIKFYL